MTKYVPLILFTVFTNFASQVMLKKGMTDLPKFELSVLSLVSNTFNIVFNPWVFFGLLMMVVSMGSHLVVLSRVEISFAYPFLGLSFVLVSLWGYYILGEDISFLRILGVVFICLGVLLIARST